MLLRLSRELRKETEQLGVTARQATLLWLVKRALGYRWPSSRPRKASRRRLSPATSTASRAPGLLERVRSTDDRRRVGLRLTEEGTRLMRRISARRTTWLADRLRTLDPAELEAVEAAIPALQRLLEENA